MMENFNSSNKAVKGIIWSAVERFSTQGAQFVISIILARMIAPHDFGLLAMLTIFISVANIFVDSGFSSALVQKKERTEKDFSTVFYFNIVISILIYLFLFFLSPFIARFYNEPVLELLTKVISLNIVINSFAVVQRAILVIRVDFKRQAKFSLISVLISGFIGIILACNGFNVWALVVQSLLCNILNTFFYILYVKWTPLVVFSVTSFKLLFSFGSKLLISGLINSIYLNLYSLVIGKFYSATDVGFFNRAYSLAQFPSSNLVSVMSRAMFPIQCELQNDIIKLKQSFFSYLRFSCFVIFPLMVGLAFVSKPLILFLLSDTWSEAILPLSIISFAYMWYPIMHIDSQLLTVIGRSDLFLKAEVIKKTAGVVILITTIQYGLLILCLGLFAYSIIDILVIIFFLKKVIDISFWDHIVNIGPILLSSLFMGFTIYSFLYLFDNLNNFISLMLALFVGVASYSLYCKLLRIKELSIICCKINSLNTKL